jgi:ent-kaurene oxidase
VLPLSLLEELSTLPTSVASAQGALEHDLLGQYTGLDMIIENRLHHTIVQRKLTPRMPLLMPRMEEALKEAFTQWFPQITIDDGWVEFQPYQALGRISARIGAEAIVGPEFCKNEGWLDISFNYTESREFASKFEGCDSFSLTVHSVFRTIVVLRFLPGWAQGLVCYLLPSYWQGQKHIKNAQALLGPKIQDLMERNDAGKWMPSDDSADDLNILSWLSHMAKGRDRNPRVIAHVQVLVALAAVHTTLLRMVNVLYDVTAAGPELREELMSEIKLTPASEWDDALLNQLPRLDSVMRESQRISPPTTLGMKRLFKTSHTFQDGTHIPAGTYVCLPIHAIENDSRHTPNPDTFDGLRSYRECEERQNAGNIDKATAAEHLFSTPTQTILNFGYGKTACPGRFFASVVIKMVVVKMLSEYEFQFLPGTQRPDNLMVHEFLFTWPWQKMLVRRRKDGQCPF